MIRPFVCLAALLALTACQPPVRLMPAPALFLNSDAVWGQSDAPFGLFGWIMGSDGVPGASLQEAGKAVALYCGGAMVGRAIGSLLLARFSASKLLALFTAIAALGQGPWQGDMNAVIASCSEYTWLTKHKRVDGTMYSCTSLGVKLGGGLGTAITGWLLAFSNYDKALAVQPESCINMLKLMYLVIPFVLDAIITFILSRMKVEEANDKIRAEMKN